jgi:hypothetical protein
MSLAAKPSLPTDARLKQPIPQRIPVAPIGSSSGVPGGVRLLTQPETVVVQLVLQVPKWSQAVITSVMESP